MVDSVAASEGPSSGSASSGSCGSALPVAKDHVDNEENGSEMHGVAIGDQKEAKANCTEDSFAIGVKTRFLILLICNWFHLQLV